MNWIPIENTQQLDAIAQRSQQAPCLIFKHSTRCNISSIAKFRLEEDWHFSPEQLEPYFLDLIAMRQVSDEIAERFSVYHESPQALLIWQGECVHDASHLDISVSELEEALLAVALAFP